MIPRLRNATVLGAGTMGAQIACLLAGSGARVRLLDLDRPTAAAGLDRATKTKPSPLYAAGDAGRVEVGGFDEIETALETSDWIVEAIVEQPEPKRVLFERVDAALAGRAPDAWPLVSSNTSGISIARLGEGRSEPFRRAFLGTHFFNPPRYSRLLELIPLPSTDPARIAWIEDVASRRLGKGTVRAKDRPAFIANRLGVHGLQVALELAVQYGLGVDEVDELTGPLIGRPKSATFRTLDLVGLDVAIAVAEHCYADLPDDPERERFRGSPILAALKERGALGEKAGGGFYRRTDGPAGSEILALDLETLEYRPRRRLTSGAVEMARLEPDLGRRIAALIRADDRAGRFLWDLLSAGLVYAATVAPETADDADSVDRAMRWGFGHELGPFQLWDALGPAAVVERLATEERPIPELARSVAARPGAARPGAARPGAARSVAARPEIAPQEAARPEAAATGRFGGLGADGRPFTTSFATLAIVPAPLPPEPDLDERRKAVSGLPANAAASLVDLGDGILGLELHGKLNIIGPDTVELILRGTELAANRYDGLVLGTRKPEFSAGANLALILIEADDGEWDELDRGIRRFQAAARAIRYAPVPVVAAPRGLTLGGGTEFVLAAARRQPLAETYIGLVETGVGLIPAGGGATAMARRAAEDAALAADGDLFAFFRHRFEPVALATVSTSAAGARAMGLFDAADAITFDVDRQWADAKAVARHLADLGYTPPPEAPIAVVGRRGLAAARSLTFNQRFGEYISDHDRKVVLELAGVMSGGDVAEGSLLGEAYLLDLEREAFLRLLGEAKTRERIRYTLKTGKPLRN